MYFKIEHSNLYPARSQRTIEYISINTSLHESHIAGRIASLTSQLKMTSPENVVYHY